MVNLILIILMYRYMGESMKKIGIITAMTEEYNSISELMDNIEKINIYNLEITLRRN